MHQDIELRRNVIKELDFDPAVTSSGIGVAVSNGIVTLTGHVPTYFEQAAALRAVQRVRGVQAVAQELTVRFTNGPRHSDDEIASRALTILKWTLHGDNEIGVVVESGWITLSGVVNWAFERTAAAEAVRKLGGVTGVTNSIALRPRVEASNIRKEILDAFRRSAELDGAGIDVNVDGTRVTLKGKVKAWHERRLAEEAAWCVPGVTEVHDALTLT